MDPVMHRTAPTDGYINLAQMPHQTMPAQSFDSSDQPSQLNHPNQLSQSNHPSHLNHPGQLVFHAVPRQQAQPQLRHRLPSHRPPRFKKALVLPPRPHARTPYRMHKPADHVPRRARTPMPSRPPRVTHHSALPMDALQNWLAQSINADFEGPEVECLDEDSMPPTPASVPYIALSPLSPATSGGDASSPVGSARYYGHGHADMDGPQVKAPPEDERTGQMDGACYVDVSLQHREMRRQQMAMNMQQMQQMNMQQMNMQAQAQAQAELQDAQFHAQLQMQFEMQQQQEYQQEYHQQYQHQHHAYAHGYHELATPSSTPMAASLSASSAATAYDTYDMVRSGESLPSATSSFSSMGSLADGHMVVYGSTLAPAPAMQTSYSAQSAQSAQSARSAQSAQSASSLVSESARYPLYAPSVMPPALMMGTPAVSGAPTMSGMSSRKRSADAMDDEHPVTAKRVCMQTHDAFDISDFVDMNNFVTAGTSTSPRVQLVDPVLATSPAVHDTMALAVTTPRAQVGVSGVSGMTGTSSFYTDNDAGYGHGTVSPRDIHINPIDVETDTVKAEPDSDPVGCVYGPPQGSVVFDARLLPAEPGVDDVYTFGEALDAGAVSAPMPPFSMVLPPSAPSFPVQTQVQTPMPYAMPLTHSQTHTHTHTRPEMHPQMHPMHPMHTQMHPQMHTPDESHYAAMERERKDSLLLQLKHEGYTYREIREKGQFSEAESTLRGRFRTLTKAKTERVRKPQWTQADDRLLVAAVEAFARGRPRGQYKVAWKAVADRIKDCGGSYRFGNTTCRKRYDYLVQHGFVQSVPYNSEDEYEYEYDERDERDEREHGEHGEFF